MPKIPDDLSKLSADELKALEDTAVSAFNDNATDDASDDVVAELTVLADGIDRVRAERSTRETATAEKKSTLTSLAERVNASAGEGEGEGEKEGEAEKPAETPAPADAPKEAEKPADAPKEGEKEAVTASISDLKKNAPARTQPRPTDPHADDAIGDVSITAAAGVPGYNSGDVLNGLSDVGKALVKRQRHLGKGDGDDVPVVTFNLDLGEDRKLTRDDNVIDRLRDFDMSSQGIVAAGGLCAPVNNYYSQMVIAEAMRPVRDALANFNADRGGIRFNPPPKMSQITSGLGTMTAAQDAANGTKSCFTVTCPTIQEADIVAIYNCLTFGNFSARTFPEQVEAWTTLALAAQARLSEQFLLDGIAANCTTVTTAGLVGAGRELFARYGQAAAGVRSRNRMAPDAPLHVLLPAWSLDLVQADFARTFTDENGLISMGKQDITNLFGTRGLNVSWYLDSKTGGGQVFGGPVGGQTFADGVTAVGTTFTSATAGFNTGDVGKTISGGTIPAGATIASVQSSTSVTLSAAATAAATGVTFSLAQRNVLVQFPTTVYGYMFPEGSFLHLDGGTLDLGLVRDSTLNSTNQFRMFTENFEQVAFVGVEALEIVSTLNADGSYAAARSIALPINS